MALIKCPECGKEISDQADFCPNCGYSFEGKKIKKDRIRNGRDKTSTAMILNSVATVAWIVFFVYIFLVLGGVHINAIDDPDSRLNRYFTWEERQNIELDQVNKFESAGYEIEYILGDDKQLYLTAPATFFYSALCGAILSCILGFVLYKMKIKNKVRFFLSFIYLGIAIISMVAYMRTMLQIVFITGGLFGITLIPFILQIFAAVKYISGARLQSVDVSE